MATLSTHKKWQESYRSLNPLNTKINGYWLPTIRAAIELSQKNPGKAIEILDEAGPYELGTPGPQPELGAMLYPVYLRGQAYLALHPGSAATLEFRKYLDHKGIAINSVLAALARLGLAPAYGLQHNTTEAHAAYESFLTLWKSADPDIPVYREAKAEYAKLQ